MQKKTAELRCKRGNTMNPSHPALSIIMEIIIWSYCQGQQHFRLHFLFSPSSCSNMCSSKQSWTKLRWKLSVALDSYLCPRALQNCCKRIEIILHAHTTNNRVPSVDQDVIDLSIAARRLLCWNDSLRLQDCKLWFAFRILRYIIGLSCECSGRLHTIDIFLQFAVKVDS